jgi:hypothetical protein
VQSRSGYYVVSAPSGADDDLEFIGRLAADLGELTLQFPAINGPGGAGALPLGGPGVG